MRVEVGRYVHGQRVKAKGSGVGIQKCPPNPNILSVADRLKAIHF